MKNIFLLVVLLFFAGCKKNEAKTDKVLQDSTSQKTKASEIAGTDPESKKEDLRKINDEILIILKNKNYKSFAEFIHPEKGVRFSMYAFTSINEDKHFTKPDFIKYQPTKTIFTWGARDGSGDPYKATVNQYLKDWVFVKDFTNASYSANEFQAGGNSLNNLKEIYPDTDFTENYIQGTGKNNEMDWNTLRLIFEEFQGKYYLVAVVNDRWTI
ncbi:hypothetical protein [Chryseobacterium chendengshani]|uniref:hypothetical protein n=1 Tax=unclassified Chryseobacterium TaxID=2593645 RepID=UPI001C6414CD|nr:MULTISPECIES: hypothetical protein [unclassified Chryseobacterium]MBW7676480.1 hypothetical protein [Chryseobacterium sp. LJ756]MBW8523971.1 hypothetical protein [Chryseobacterium sp. LJ668]QYK16911.1 hypothetical protein K0U91_01850 [Chryseobacterium sp. LJ668]